MSGGKRSRWGFRYAADSYIPCVEIYEANLESLWQTLELWGDRSAVFARRYGWTPAHAMRRALRWADQNS